VAHSGRAVMRATVVPHVAAVVATVVVLLPCPAAASAWIESESTWIWLGPVIGVALILCIAVTCICKRSVRITNDSLPVLLRLSAWHHCVPLNRRATDLTCIAAVVLCLLRVGSQVGGRACCLQCIAHPPHHTAPHLARRAQNQSAHPRTAARAGRHAQAGH